MKRLQVGFSPAVDMERLGQLAIVGTNTYSIVGKTIVTFILVADYEGDPWLYQSLSGGVYAGYANGSLPAAIFEGDGIRKSHPLGQDDLAFVVFTREVEGKLRDPQKYLRVTARKLLKELHEISEYEDLMRQQQEPDPSGLG